MLRDLVLKNRSYRRFYEAAPLDRKTLVELVDLARVTASARNRQPLRYIVSSERETNERIFACLAWALDLKDWGGPAEGERPSGYIIILSDREITDNPGCDHGIAAQTILLGAAERGLGGCMLGSIDRDALRKVLRIPERYDIILAVALGTPNETVVLEDVGPDADTLYYRDDQGVHHVPKHALADVILDT